MNSCGVKRWLICWVWVYRMLSRVSSVSGDASMVKRGACEPSAAVITTNSNSTAFGQPRMKSTLARARRPPLGLFAELGITLDSFQVEITHENVQVLAFFTHGQVGLGGGRELLEVVEHPEGERFRIFEIAQRVQQAVDEGCRTITQV